MEEGGGPAGVVDGLLNRLRDLSGVEGGLVSGTVKAILRDFCANGLMAVRWTKSKPSRLGSFQSNRETAPNGLPTG